MSQPERPARPPAPGIEFIPTELRERNQWVLWKYELRGDVWTKIPYQARRPRSKAKADDPTTWGAFDEAWSAYQRGGFDGIGYEFAAGDPYFGADVDKCLRDGEVLEWATPILGRLEGSYADISPSGNGVKFIARGKLPEDTGTRRNGMGPDGKGALELYDHGRFFTLTGNVFGEVGSASLELQNAATELYRMAKERAMRAEDEDKFWLGEESTVRFSTPSNQTAGQPKSKPSAFNAKVTDDAQPSELSDDELIKRIRGSKQGPQFAQLFDHGDTSGHAGDESSADLALLNILAFWTGRAPSRMERIFGRSALGRRDKWTGRPDYRQRTIKAAIDGTKETYHAQPSTVHLTEWGNAQRIIADHGTDIRYCKSLGSWLDWDGARWRIDEKGVIWGRAKDTVRRLAHEAASTDDDKQRGQLLKWALKSEEKKVIGASIELAWSEPGIAILPDELDADPWQLNTSSGTVDLRTGKLRDHRREDLISKVTGVPYDSAATCPRWEKTLSEIFAGDDKLVAYVKRALGYSLTGVIGEHALFLCYGTGRNGKNTLLDTVQTALGDYATVANPRTFMTIGQNDHLAMVADLMGRRFVPTDEVEEGEQLAESMVKRVTGNKFIKARFMHRNPFTFPAQFKIWMLANCKPEIHGQDEGIWSRIRLIPFDVFFPPEKRIKGLSDILVKEEGPGILRWLVEGCLEWQRIGLKEPQKVLDAIKDYRSEQDMAGDFIGQCCDSFLDKPHIVPMPKVNTSKLYGRYADWCKANGEKKIMTKRRFASDLTKRGYPDDPSNGVHYRAGIKLKDVIGDTSDESREPGSDG